MDEEIEIRDTRNGEWHWVYNAVIADIHLSPADKLVYSAISTFGGYVKISPTIKQICKKCNLSERQVQLSLRTLEETDYLKIEPKTGRGNTNIYFLLKRPKGCRFCPFYLKGADNAVKGADIAVPTTIDNIKIITDTPKKAVGYYPPFVERELVPDEDLTTTKSLKRKEAIKVRGYNPAETDKLLKWGEAKLGRKYPSPLKQKAAIASMLASGFPAEEIKAKWEELEDSDFWQEKGIDFTIVLSQISKHKPKNDKLNKWEV